MASTRKRLRNVLKRLESRLSRMATKITTPSVVIAKLSLPYIHSNSVGPAVLARLIQLEAIGEESNNRLTCRIVSVSVDPGSGIRGNIVLVHEYRVGN
jgi:hypothetical protein